VPSTLQNCLDHHIFGYLKVEEESFEIDQRNVGLSLALKENRIRTIQPYSNIG
jgi:hypothetical protein